MRSRFTAMRYVILVCLDVSSALAVLTTANSHSLEAHPGRLDDALISLACIRRAAWLILSLRACEGASIRLERELRGARSSQLSSRGYL